MVGTTGGCVARLIGALIAIPLAPGSIWFYKR